MRQTLKKPWKKWENIEKTFKKLEKTLEISWENIGQPLGKYWKNLANLKGNS
jgi:hypothetical protein